MKEQEDVWAAISKLGTGDLSGAHTNINGIHVQGAKFKFTNCSIYGTKVNEPVLGFHIVFEADSVNGVIIVKTK